MKKLTTIALFLGLVFAGCSKESSEGGDEPPKKMGAAPVAGGDAVQKADEYFKQVCVACHGESGHGDGPGAATLNPKPRNYSDAAWQASVTDADIAKIIREGGSAVGKSAMMPANPGLKPEVIDALVKKIRSFAAAATPTPTPGSAATPTPAPGSAAAPTPAPTPAPTTP